MCDFFKLIFIKVNFFNQSIVLWTFFKHYFLPIKKSDALLRMNDAIKSTGK